MPANIVIANEQACWGAGRRRVSTASKLLRGAGLDFDLWKTSERGHARELARSAACDGPDRVIVIGGDGTLNEVVEGLLDSGCAPLPPVGIIPAGSSNDFAKSLGVPQDLSDACRTVADGSPAWVDLGCAGAGRFCLASCLGAFADIAARSLEMRYLHGSFRYAAAALDVIRKFDTGWNMAVETDSENFSGEYAVLLVSNTPRFGGFVMTPGARPDDGLLDCLLIPFIRKSQALSLLLAAYRKRLPQHPRVIHFQTRSLRVHLDRPTRICKDGEVTAPPVQAVEFSTLPRAIQILRPA